MKNPPYFKRQADAPPPLCCTVARTSRFEEVDALHMVWHGRYPSYFEDARVAFGKQYGLGYMDFYQNGAVVPIKHLFIDHHAPILFAEQVHITARLHYCESARLNFEYAIYKEATLVTTGYSVQLFVKPSTNELCLNQPDFYAEFCKRWKAGMVS